MTRTRDREAESLPLTGDHYVTLNHPLPDEDRALLAQRGLVFTVSTSMQLQCLFPANKGIRTLPSDASPIYNQERTSVVGTFLVEYYQVGDVVVCLITRFAHIGSGGRAVPQESELRIVSTQAQPFGEQDE